MRLGYNCAIVPLGTSHVVGARVIGFDTGMVGLLWKALPDDLVGAGQPGDRLSDEQVARIEEDPDAPGVFLHAATPEALYGIAEMAISLADEWLEHLEKEVTDETTHQS